MKKRKGTIQTQIADRKARRKEERQSKKKNKHINSVAATARGLLSESKVDIEPQIKKRKRENDNSHNLRTKDKKVKSINKKKINNFKKKNTDIFDILDEDTAAAVRADDEEIAFLEKSLGLHKGSSKDKKKLNKEYAKLEGYGDDFGDFLDGLDNILDNITGDHIENSEEDEDYSDVDNLLEHSNDSDDSDEEVARAKALLRNELQVDLSDEEDDSEEGEEIIPMKDGDDYEDYKYERSSGEDIIPEHEQDSSDNQSDDSSDVEASEEEAINEGKVRDHDEEHIYRPVAGQDLYGNTIDNERTDEERPQKYIPPHLRRQHTKKINESNSQEINDNDPDRKESLRSLQRLLNNSLNRLADNTLESVGKSISSIYESNEYSVRDTNDCFWKNIKMACVVEHMVRDSLIPIYIACVAGVHFQSGDSVQLGGDVLERTVLALWNEIKKYREIHSHAEPFGSKEASNYLLILCYLYNFGVVHCTIIYDLVRHFIKEFSELDVELLLLILSHCGLQLRSDDPTALKDIVIMVQKRSVEVMNEKEADGTKLSTSRAQFMVTAITDLKNNKRKDRDVTIGEKTSHYRRIIGRMKSVVSTLGDGKSLSSNILRVTIQDILDIESKGRWWKVGAKWAGHKEHGEGYNQKQQIESLVTKKTDAKQKKLLKMAATQRMNTDLRRSIFCIIMGSDDCQDAFENLIRSNLLKGKNEREVVRVIIHCCGTEKVYNPYYAFLSNRLCEYQSNCRFSFQLSLWDQFKQFNEMKPRKAANLAKLLANLLINNRMNLNVLKVIDINPNDMPESAVIFLTILFTNILEAFDDTDQITLFFKRGDPTKEYLEQKASETADDDNAFAGNEREVLKENINIFLLHYLQQSPKNKKKSKFRKNYKAAVKALENDGFDMMF